MIKVLFGLVVFFSVFVILMFILDAKIDALPEKNKFRKWWRDHIIGDDFYGE